MAAAADVDVLRDRRDRDDSFFLAVLGAQHDAVADRVARALHVDARAVERQHARAPAVRAVHEPHQLAATRADEPEEADDLARAHREARRFAQCRPVDAFGEKPHVAERARRVMVDVRDLAPDHLGDEPLARHVGQRFVRRDLAAVAKDRARIAQPVDLVHPVRDVDQRAALRTQVVDQLEQHFRLAMRQRARRFVERDHARVAHQRLADLDHLPLRDRQPPEPRIGIEIDAHLGEPLAHVTLRLAFPHPAERVRQAAEQQVFRDRQVGHVLQFLVNHRDAGRDRRGRIRELHGLAVDQHAARIGLIFAAENLQQRRLARAVLAHQAMHLARMHVERNAVECAHAGKHLADIVKTQCR